MFSQTDVSEMLIAVLMELDTITSLGIVKLFGKNVVIEMSIGTLSGDDANQITKAADLVINGIRATVDVKKSETGDRVEEMNIGIRESAVVRTICRPAELVITLIDLAGAVNQM